MGCSILWGIMLVVVGLWIWASNHGMAVFRFSRDWPVLFVLLGIYIIIAVRRRRFFIH